ncbi:hypothetical protein D3C81_924900 [compost metagenome]
MHGLRLVHQHALLAGALAMVVHAPVGIVADAAGLANHQVGRHQARFQRRCIVCAIAAARMVQEASAGLLDGLLRHVGAVRVRPHFAVYIIAHIQYGFFAHASQQLRLQRGAGYGRWRGHPLQAQQFAHQILHPLAEPFDLARQPRPRRQAGRDRRHFGQFLARQRQLRIADHDLRARAHQLRLQLRDAGCLRSQLRTAARLRAAIFRHQHAMLVRDHVLVAIHTAHHALLHRPWRHGASPSLPHGFAL